MPPGTVELCAVVEGTAYLIQTRCHPSLRSVLFPVSCVCAVAGRHRGVVKRALVDKAQGKFAYLDGGLLEGRVSADEGAEPIEAWID